MISLISIDVAPVEAICVVEAATFECDGRRARGRLTADATFGRGTTVRRVRAQVQRRGRPAATGHELGSVPRSFAPVPRTLGERRCLECVGCCVRFVHESGAHGLHGSAAYHVSNFSDVAGVGHAPCRWLFLLIPVDVGTGLDVARSDVLQIVLLVDISAFQSSRFSLAVPEVALNLYVAEPVVLLVLGRLALQTHEKSALALSYLWTVIGCEMMMNITHLPTRSSFGVRATFNRAESLHLLSASGPFGRMS